MTFSAEVKLQVVLISIEAAAFLALAVWCLGRRRTRWGRRGAVGAGLLGLAKGVQALGAFEMVFLHTQHIDQALANHRHSYTWLNLAVAVGAVVLVSAFIDRRRTPLSSGLGSRLGGRFGSRFGRL